jgi:hypothetical protein
METTTGDSMTPASRGDAADAVCCRFVSRALAAAHHHEHRMDCPRYVANGSQIGSGPVESGCKTVVGNRLTGGGMRWGEVGSNAVCHLRALYLSGPLCWDSFWNPSAN